MWKQTVDWLIKGTRILDTWKSPMLKTIYPPTELQYLGKKESPWEIQLEFKLVLSDVANICATKLEGFYENDFWVWTVSKGPFIKVFRFKELKLPSMSWDLDPNDKTGMVYITFPVVSPFINKESGLYEFMRCQVKYGSKNVKYSQSLNTRGFLYLHYNGGICGAGQFLLTEYKCAQFGVVDSIKRPTKLVNVFLVKECLEDPKSKDTKASIRDQVSQICNDWVERYDLKEDHKNEVIEYIIQEMAMQWKTQKYDATKVISYLKYDDLYEREHTGKDKLDMTCDIQAVIEFLKNRSSEGKETPSMAIVRFKM